MTTINTMHDLHRILVEHPEWRSELRKILLTDELLALPQRLAEYAEVSDRKFDALSGETRGNTSRIEELTVETRENTNRIEELIRETRQNTNHIGELKGMFIGRTAREDGPIIASDMGLRWRRTLEQNEIIRIADEARRGGAAEDIPRDYMRGFVRADMIFEAEDDIGDEFYVAVEISYTADERDTNRARRHAEYLTRFTGTPAYAAIASVHIDNRIEDIVTENNSQPHGTTQEMKVFWSRLPELERAN